MKEHYKMYELLKDLPFIGAKAGTIVVSTLADEYRGVDLDEDQECFFGNIYRSDIDEFREWFRELNQVYYVNPKRLEVEILTAKIYEPWNAQMIDNSFIYKDIAEKRLRWLEAQSVLLKDSTQGAVIVYYDRKARDLYWSISSSKIYSPISFETDMDAIRSIQSHEKEWKTYLGVE